MQMETQEVSWLEVLSVEHLAKHQTLQPVSTVKCPLSIGQFYT